MAKRPKRATPKPQQPKRQLIRWEGGIGIGNVIVLVVLLCSVTAGGFSFYYKANGTADEVEKLVEQIDTLNKSVDDNDKNMRLLVDSSAGKITQEINFMRQEVIKVTTEQDGIQRQIDDMKDDLRELDSE